MRVRAERIDDLLRELDSIADPHVQSIVRELLQSVTELHAACLERVLEVLSESGSPCDLVINRLGDDELVGPLMALHGLHPLALPDRLAQALEKAGTELKKQGGEAEVLSLHDGIARVKLRCNSHGCGSTAGSARIALEDAIYNAAPDLLSLLIEEVPIAPLDFVPLEALGVGSAI